MSTTKLDSTPALFNSTRFLNQTVSLFAYAFSVFVLFGPSFSGAAN